MKLKPRTAEILVTVAASLIVAIGTLQLWSKHDFCRGWADHYYSRATQLRTDAVNPALAPAEREEYLVAANLHEMISDKYQSVAWQPWKPYPSYPLVSTEEQARASRDE